MMLDYKNSDNRSWLYLERVGVLSDAGFPQLFFALFESSEVVLNQERRVELADRHVVLLRCTHHDTQ